MLRTLTDLYGSSWRYALACPLLFLVPVVAEAVQHVAEYAQDFYNNIASARAVEHGLLRTSLGSIKILSLFLAGYWLMRWLEWHDPVRTVGFDRASLRTFLPLLALDLVLALPPIWGPVFSPAFAKLILWIGLPSFLLGVLISDWKRTAALGEAGGPVHSIRLIAPVFLWAFGFSLAAILPPMAVHYALGFGSMKANGLAQFAMLAADTLFVGYLGAIVAAVPWYISERARKRRISVTAY